MVRFRHWMFFAAVSLGILLLPPAAGEQPDPEAKVKEVVVRFLQRIKDKDVRRLAEMAATPWLAEGQRVVKDADELKKLLQQKLGKFDVPKTALEPLSVIPYTETAEMVKDDAVRKVLDQILKKEDRIVLVGSKKEKAVRYVLVRMGGAAPRVVGGPYRLTYLLMPNLIPEAAAKALANAEKVELLSLDPERQRKKPANDFHGWKVLGRTEVKNEKTRKVLVAALRRSAAESEGLAAFCFNPRHGLRVTRQEKVVDFVICFECFQVNVFVGDRAAKGFLITDSSQPVFDKALRDARVPLAKKSEK